MRYFATERPYFPTTQVVAAEDDTEVSLIGSVHIQGGVDVESAEKGVAKTYRLRRGEQIQFFQEQDLTGRASGRTSRSASGWAIRRWRSRRATCCGDSSQTALFPVQSWGREYAAVPYRSRRSRKSPRIPLQVTARRRRHGPHLRAERAEGRAVVARGRTSPPLHVAGAVRREEPGHRAPLCLFSYMTGEEFAKAQGYQGDPEFVPVIPAEQYLGKYVFLVDTTYPNSQLVVVRSREERQGLRACRPRLRRRARGVDASRDVR